jgi:hypothetical protein
LEILTVTLPQKLILNFFCATGIFWISKKISPWGLQLISTGATSTTLSLSRRVDNVDHSTTTKDPSLLTNRADSE